MSEYGTNIGGDNGLPPADLLKISRATLLPVDDDTGVTRALAIGDLTDKAGNVKLGGALTGEAPLGTPIDAGFVAGAVPLSALAAFTGAGLVGTSGAGAPYVITIGSGMHFAGDTLVTDDVAIAQPTLGKLVYRVTPGGL